MNLTEYQIKVYSGTICPYCKSETRITTEEEIYGTTYKGRKMICCKNFPNCDSYVGTHKEDDTSLGRLADKSLRTYKKATHDAFDRIWMKKHCTREESYVHLSNAIGIPINYTHIGMFNIKTCKKAINWANQVFSDLEIESEKTEELFEWMKKQAIKENDYNKINPIP